MEERDPAFLDVSVDVLPLGRVEVAGLGDADQRLVAPLDQLRGAALDELDPVGRDRVRVLDEDELDLLVEAVGLPPEPVPDPLRLGQLAPHDIPGRIDLDLDAVRLVHALAHAG